MKKKCPNCKKYKLKKMEPLTLYGQKYAPYRCENCGSVLANVLSPEEFQERIEKMEPQPVDGITCPYCEEDLKLFIWVKVR